MKHLSSIARSVGSFAGPWAGTGVFLGIFLGAWTAATNDFRSFRDTLLLELALVAAFGALFALAGLGLGIPVVVAARIRRRPLATSELGLATAIAIGTAIYAARWFEFQAGYPQLYPFVDDFGSMMAVVAGVLGLCAAATALATVALARAASALRHRQLLPSARATGVVAAALALGSSAVIGARPDARAQAADAPAAAEDAPRIFPLAADHGRVLVVGCDGADWHVIDDLFAQGELPTLRRLVENGVRAPLQTIRDRPSPSLWTSIATGQPPPRHGIFDFYVQTIVGSNTPVALFPRHFGLNAGLLLHDLFGDRVVRVTPVHGGLIRGPRLWEMLASHGVSVAVVNWLVTWPVAETDALVVSDRTHTQLLEDEAAAARAAGAVAAASPLWRPAELGPLLAAAFDDEGARGSEDAFVGAVSSRLQDRYRPDVMIAYFRDVDAAEHLFWDEYEPRFFRARARGGPDPADSPVPQAYRRFDTLLGELLARMGEDAFVVVVSDHGHGPRFSWLGRGTPGGHTNSPDGIFLTAGPGIRAGEIIAAPSCYDIAPTVLRLAGLPAARDMPGRVLREVFEDGQGPATSVRVATYGPAAAGDEDVQGGPGDAAILENLKALGYIQ